MKTAEERAFEFLGLPANTGLTAYGKKNYEEALALIRADRGELLKEAQEHAIAAIVEEFWVGREVISDFVRERLEKKLQSHFDELRKEAL